VADCGLIGINVCNHSNGLVGVLLGNGDGTFQPVVTYDSGGSTTVSIAVADVNADGKPDVLVANECDNSSTCAVGSVGVLLGNGDGTFQAATTYDVGYAIDSLAIADVNGDGKLDLLVAKGGTSNNVGVLLGNGDGTFQPVVDYDSGGNTALSVVAADVNGDGKPDLLVGNACDMSNNCADGSVGVLLGNGDGTFQPVVNYGSGGSGVWALAVADVNGDGTPDLLDASFFYNTLGVLLGNGDGTFQAVTTYGSGGTLPRSIAVADLNGDGLLDVAVANFCGGCLPGKLGVLLNNTADTTPPVITLSATPKILWPPNGKMVPVTVSGTITDTGSGVNANSAAYSVKDEYGEVQPMGAITLGPGANYSFTILLQASRRGSDLDGRRYTITVRAKDNAANGGSKTRAVIVPHDQGD
jgi:FG-GAP-like repeat